MFEILSGKTHTVKCEYLPFRVPPRTCDKTHMPEDTEIERVKAALKRAMERKEIAAKPLSTAAGLGETAVRDIMLAKDIKLGTLQRLATALEIGVDDLIGTRSVPLTGRIGAGGTIIFEDLGVDNPMPKPPGFSGPLEALEVIGDSMWPKYNSGDVVYISRSFDGVLPKYIGEFCAVRLDTGETYLKQLMKGDKPGRFTLRSLNAADIDNVSVSWATPIVFVLPKFARDNYAAV